MQLSPRARRPPRRGRAGRAAGTSPSPTSRRSPQAHTQQGGQDNLSTGGEGEVEVPPSSPPWLVTEWVRSEIEKLLPPQYYHFQGPTSPLPRPHLSPDPASRGRGGPPKFVPPQYYHFWDPDFPEQFEFPSHGSQSWLAGSRKPPLPIPPSLWRGCPPCPGMDGVWMWDFERSV